MSYNFSNFAQSVNLSKKLILGTSRWGDTISFKNAVSLIEEWYYVHDMIHIDTATNYPINGGEDTALTYLEEYFRNNHTCNFHVTVKVGSISRWKVPEFDLSPEFLIKTCDGVLNKLQHHVQCLMVHWDNRCDDYDAVIKTMATLCGYGLDVGISGVVDAATYSKVIRDLGIKVNVQCRYSNVEWYVDHIPGQYYNAYKISEGFDDYGSGLISAYGNPLLDGVLIGPKNIEQLLNSIQYVKS